MKLSVIADDASVMHVQCVGKITQDDFPLDGEPMGTLLAYAGGFRRKVLLNLEQATYIDSSGISWLLICHKHFVQNGGRLVVHTVPPLVYQVIQLVRLEKILAFAVDAPSARAIALRDEK